MKLTEDKVQKFLYSIKNGSALSSQQFLILMAEFCLRIKEEIDAKDIGGAESIIMHYWEISEPTDTDK